ncbi:MAG: hypothetical protein AABX52_01025 [Nanoarchaeota archaeon]
MKEIELNALKDLIGVYTHYLDSGLSTELINKAKEVYDEYHPMNTLLTQDINIAVGKLFPLAYPDAGSGVQNPTKEEVIKMLSNLTKYKHELEK